LSIKKKTSALKSQSRRYHDPRPANIQNWRGAHTAVEAAGITLAAIARADGFEVFTHPGRIATMAIAGVVDVA
jgi:hypothetical protein